MRLLFLTPSLAVPMRSGGAIMLYNYIRELSQNHDIDVVAFTDQGDAECGDLIRLCRNFLYVKRPVFRLTRFSRLVNKMIGVPTQISPYKSKEIAQLIAQKCQTEKYDAIIFQFSEMAQFKPKDFLGAAILMMEDPLFLKFRRSEDLHSSPLMRMRIRYEAELIRRYERRTAKSFDRVLLISQKDLDDYRSILPECRFDWLPYGVDIHYFSPSDQVKRKPNMIIITGNMFHIPNVDAVQFFCEHVFPLVLCQVADARLFLVGANPAPSVQKWGAQDNIVVTGSVPDLRPYLQAAQVSVCAVQLKIGTQTKVLEAMACGTPVVTTSAGNNGINALSGQHLYVADDPGAMADCVVSLLEGKQWGTFSQNGRQFVVENFSWENGAVKLEKLIEIVLHERKVESPMMGLVES